MSRLDPSLYNSKWMQGILEDAKKRLDSTRFQSDVMPTMFDNTALDVPGAGETVSFAFTPGFITTIKMGYRKLVYHSDNKSEFRLASDETSKPAEGEDHGHAAHKCDGSCKH